MTRQRVLQRGDDDGKCEDAKSEEHGSHSALSAAASDTVADHTDDACAGIARPVELVSRWSYQNGDANEYCNGCRCGQLDARDDLITLGEPPIVNKATGDSKRKQMRECQTDCGAPHQAKDLTGHRNDILQRGQCSKQADRHIEGHRPGLFA
jgi:hypothetical protein